MDLHRAAQLIAAKGNVADDPGVLLAPEHKPTTRQLADAYRAMAVRGVPPHEARAAIETIAHHHNIESPWS